MFCHLKCLSTPASVWGVKEMHIFGFLLFYWQLADFPKEHFLSHSSWQNCQPQHAPPQHSRVLWQGIRCASKGNQDLPSRNSLWHLYGDCLEVGDAWCWSIPCEEHPGLAKLLVHPLRSPYCPTYLTSPLLQQVQLNPARQYPDNQTNDQTIQTAPLNAGEMSNTLMETSVWKGVTAIIFDKGGQKEANQYAEFRLNFVGRDKLSGFLCQWY